MNIPQTYCYTAISDKNVPCRSQSRRLPLFLLFLLAAGAVSTGSQGEAAPAPEKGASGSKPNVIFILCDDLGYGDVGVFFQNVRRQKGVPCEFTPNVDAMAAQGIQLLDHYTAAPVCAPARGSLLAGVHQGHAGVRDNQFDKALENNHTLATVLKQAGYATAAIGKWGLQGTRAIPPSENETSKSGADDNPKVWDAYPTKRGFDYYFGYVRHADGHEHYPKEGLHGGAKQVWDGDREVSALMDKCYTTDLFTACAKKWITDQHTAHPGQPFFLYLAYDTPHAVTELPTMAYPSGGGLRGGMQWLGTPGAMITTASGTPDSYEYPEFANAVYTGPEFGKSGERGPANGTHPWPNICKRYATDVRRIDDAVGDIVHLLRDLEIDDNTLVVFTSDNGPSPESYLPEENHPNFFRSFGPFDGIKRDCWEGGIHMGAIARWPAVIPPHQVSHTPSQFHDWMATFADLAGLPAPARTDGVSLLPTLTGRGPQPPSTIYVEYFFKGKTPDYPEFLAAHRGRPRNQMQVLRIGDLLGVRYDIHSQADDFEIYDVARDPQESSNLASENTALEMQMKDTVLRLRRPDPSAARPYDNELVPALNTQRVIQGIQWRAYEGHFPWVPKAEFLTPSVSGTGVAPAVSLLPRKEDIAMLFTGYIKVPADGTYAFSLKADTGGLLRIHEATVIDADYGYVAGTERNGTVRLQAGMHPFRLYYRHGSTGSPHLSLEWRFSGSSKEPIPDNAYYRAVVGSN